MRLYIQQVLAIVRKDALVELRTRDATTSMLVFAVMAIVMFSFALRLRVDSLRPLVPGVLWVVLVFAGTLGLNRSLSVEQANQCMDGLLLAPCDRSAIFVGKAVANAIFMLLVAAIVVPAMAVLFDESLLQAGTALTVFLGIAGYAGAGTLIATMAASTRARDVFLPILLFPLALPLVIACVIVTSGFLDQLALSEFGAWIGVILSFLIIFWTAGTLLFDFIVEA